MKDKASFYNIYKSEKIEGKYDKKNGELIEKGSLLQESYVKSRMESFRTSGIYYELVKKPKKKKKPKAS